MAMKQGIAAFLGLVMLGAAGCGSESPASTTECPPPVVTPAAATPTPKPTAKATAKPSTSASAKPSSSGSAKPKPTTSVAPADPDPADAPDEAPAEDALAMLNTVKDTTLGGSMKATLSTYEMKLDKSKSNSATFNLQLQDKSYRLDCIKHTKPNNVGSKTVLVYGQDSARVKPTGILSLVTVTLKLTDSNLISLNGITLDKILCHGVLERVTGGGYTAEVAGKTKIGTDSITLVKLKPESGVHPLSADADYEYVGFDDNNLYRMWALYAKPEKGLTNNLMYQITVDAAESGVAIDPSVFKI